MKKASRVLSVILTYAMVITIFNPVLKAAEIIAPINKIPPQSTRQTDISEIFVPASGDDFHTISSEGKLHAVYPEIDDNSMGQNTVVAPLSTIDVTPAEFNTIDVPSVVNGITEQNRPLKSFVSEEISPYTGELTLRFDDINLPGRNGFDLNIGRVFQSAQADFAEKKIILNSSLSPINTYAETSYLNDRYNLGTGFSFNFPSVQIVKEYEPFILIDTFAYYEHKTTYYHTGGGSVFEVDANSDSGLKGYYTKDVKFKTEPSSAFTNGQKTSAYSFTDADKTVQYFADDGRLIGIKDKFGNQIKFEHTMKQTANYVPNGGFEYGTDMWNAVSGAQAVYNKGRYDNTSLRLNHGDFTYAASQAIQVEPNGASYTVSADVFVGGSVASGVFLEVHLLDAAHNERQVKLIPIPTNLTSNTWHEITGTFSTASSTQYVFVAVVADNSADNVYFDNIAVYKPQPLITKITDSIGREVNFDYRGKMENESGDQSIVLTIKKPGSSSVAKSVTYKRKVLTLPFRDSGNENRAFHKWYLVSSDTEGTDDFPVYYDYGGTLPGDIYDTLLWKARLIGNSSSTVKPMLTHVRYKNHRSVYEYEKVQKNLGRHGYYDTLRVSSRYDQYYVTSKTFIGAENRMDYAYGDANIDNETGYPNIRFSDPDSYIGDIFTYSTTATATFSPDDKLITTNTYKNGRLYTLSSNNPKTGHRIDKNYTYDDVFKDSAVFVATTTWGDPGTYVNTYYGMSYNSWGGLETKTQELTDDLYFEIPNAREKYTTTYAYHPVHKKIVSVQYYNDMDGGLITEELEYDNTYGRLECTVNAMGEKTDYFYENSEYPGNVTKIKMDDPSNTHHVFGNHIAQTAYTYDQYGAFVETVGQKYQGGTSVTQYEYEYLYGNVTKKINPDGDYFEYEYDGIGRIKSESSPLIQGDGYQFRRVTEYNYFKDLMSTATYTVDPTRLFDLIQVEEWEYNTSNELYYLSGVTRYFYGGLGEGLMVHQLDLDRPSGGSFVPIITQYCYDDYTRLTEAIDDDGKNTKAKYDAFGRIEELTDNAGNKYVTEYDLTERTKLSYLMPASAPLTKENHIKLQYDVFGNLTASYAYPDGYNNTPISAEYSYNIAGKIEGYTDPNGNEYGYEYDKAGRLMKTLLPDGTSATAGYNKFNMPNFEHQYNTDGDVAASRATIVDEAGNKLFAFYQFNNLLSHSDAYRSDAMGRITLKNEGGAIYAMQYDGAGNIKKLTSDETDINYKYGSHGAVKIIPTDSTLTANQYDYYNFGGLFSKTQDSVTMAYQYTSTGQIELSADTTNMYTEYYYDNLNRIDTVYALNSDYYFDYYDDGMIKSVYSGPLTTTYTYDNLNRATSIITRRGATIINNLTYTYDNNSNILTETRNSITTTYTYDELDRLKTANYGDNNTIMYYYDTCGNRVKEIHSTGLIKTFNYDKSNRLKSVSENGIIIDNYEYNAAGALISHNSDTYIYDDWDRLSLATIDGITHSYKYDINGLRTEKGDKKYIVDANGNVIAEQNGNTTTAQNVYINSQIMSRKIGNQWYFYLKNAHGDIIGMADSNGNVVNTYDYDAWGNIINQTETVENPVKYAGEYYDSELEQYYLRARYYDSKIGRFTSLDVIKGSIANPQGMNRYIYCVNNPVNRIDPFGLDDYAVLLAVGINSQLSDNFFRWIKNEIQYRMNQNGDTVRFIECAPYGEKDKYNIVTQGGAVTVDMVAAATTAKDNINLSLTEAEIQENEKIIMIGHSGGGEAISDSYMSMDEYHRSRVTQLVVIGSPRTLINADQHKFTFIFDENDLITRWGSWKMSNNKPAHRLSVDNGIQKPGHYGYLSIYNIYKNTSMDLDYRLKVHSGYFDTAPKAANILNQFWDRAVN